ncbi:MAG: integrase core domain-containing protein [Planctomycetaceae bacterium]|nr:integrase core domain-containing protein [Planctomycetaceae bacterium]
MDNQWETGAPIPTGVLNNRYFTNIPRRHLGAGPVSLCGLGQPGRDRRRQTTWKTFLKAHWESLFATDFTTVEVWTARGLVTFYVLAVMHLPTRRVQIAGLTPHPTAQWLKQVCRNLTDGEEGFLKDASQLIVDRDTSFLALREFMTDHTPTKILLLPPRSPNLNAHLERWFRSLKSECLDRMVFFGEAALRRALAAYVAHYHAERNHQGLDNQLIEPGEEVGQMAGTIHCRDRLGGLLRYYHRAA